MNGRPNILFALADDAGMHFGAYGCPWVDTPAFDRVAREGVLFTQAYTCNSKCAPSRASIITGRNSWQLKDAENHQCHFPEEFRSVFEALAEHGYHTGHTAKGWGPGEPGTVDGRPRELTGPAYSELKWEPPAECINRTDYAANFLDFLEDNPDDRPFCFWYGCTEPHRRYEWRAGIEKNGHRPEDVDHVYGIWPDNEIVRTDLLDYGFEIENFDLHLGRMLDTLEQRGELENTLVVVSSDNGMPFPRAKGQEYFYSNHLPLAIMWGGEARAAGIVNPGRTVSDMVSFIDFAPTFLDVAGVPESESGMAPITGRSLTDIFEAEGGGQVNPERDHVLIGKERHDLGRPGDVGYPIRGIFRGDYLYVHNFEPDRWPAGNPETGYMNCDGSPTKSEIIRLRREGQTQYWEWSFGKRPEEELYNIADDPDCITNLADDAAHAELKAQLREEMERELTEQGDPRMTGGAPLDENPAADPQGLRRGFYERFMKGELEVARCITPTDVDPEAADD
ncbi:MAG: sulfatase [Armatimonadota bacterium]|jgi:N-sulfoglucosamine sulfohydrolase